MSDPHIQDIFHQFRAKQTLGFRPPSPRASNMESQPLTNPPPPLEEEIEVSQPLPSPSPPHVVSIENSFQNPSKAALPNPYSIIYHYDLAYGNSSPSNMPSSSIEPPPYEPPESPATILCNIRVHNDDLERIN